MKKYGTECIDVSIGKVKMALQALLRGVRTNHQKCSLVLLIFLPSQQLVKQAD
jgi:hypothetical protein